MRAGAASPDGSRCVGGTLGVPDTAVHGRCMAGLRARFRGPRFVGGFSLGRNGDGTIQPHDTSLPRHSLLPTLK